PIFGSFPEKWVASRHHPYLKMGPSMVEILGHCPAELLDEFRTPRPARELGKKGQLALRLKGEMFRLDVDKNLEGAAQPLGKTGWKVQLLGYDPDLLREVEKREDAGDRPSNPVVKLELTPPDGPAARWYALARLPGRLFPAEKK